MPRDLDTLLRDAGGEPAVPLDTDVTWTKGRRRRMLRRASAASGGLAGVAVLVLVASSVLSGDAGPIVPEIEPMSPPVTDEAEEADAAEEPAETEPEAEVEDRAPEPEAPDAQEALPDRDRTASEESTEPAAPPTADDGSDTDPIGDPPSEPEAAVTPDTTDDASSASPEPDWSRADDPCAIHDDGQMRAFIDVLSPVDGQQVGGAVALVGCSSVFEGTIRYRMSQGGEVLVDGFTTASAGGPELGEFRQEIPLRGSGTHTLEVFWDSPQDGEGERDLTTITFEAG